MKHLKLIALSIFLFVSLILSARKNPNIVIILADDLGWNDVGYHGSTIITPTIDSLAAHGVELNRHYTNYSCTPTRAGLLTGNHPGNYGLSGRVVSPKLNGGLDPSSFTLAEILREAGYADRACMGKWHLGHSNIKYHPLNQGFNHFYGHYGGMINYFSHYRKNELDWHRDFDTCYDEGYSTELIANEAVDWMFGRQSEAPFFLYLAFNAPHVPLQAPRRYLDLYGYDEEKGKFSEFTESADDDAAAVRRGQGNTKRQTYSAMVTAMDDAIGQVVSALELMDQLENTIIFFMSDNGGHLSEGASNKPFRGEKGTYFDGGVRVPAFIYGKGLKKRKVDGLTAYIDVTPTILALIGYKHKHEFDGLDVSDLIVGERKKNNERVLYLGKTAAVSNRWKLVDDQLFYLFHDHKEKRNQAKRNKFKQVFGIYRGILAKRKKIFEKPAVLEPGYELQKNWKMPNL